MMKALRENKMDIFDLYQVVDRKDHTFWEENKKIGGRCSPQCRWILRFLSISSGSAQTIRKRSETPFCGLEHVVRRQFAGAFLYVKIDQRNWINSYDHIVKIYMRFSTKISKWSLVKVLKRSGNHCFSNF